MTALQTDEKTDSAAPHAVVIGGGRPLPPRWSYDYNPRYDHNPYFPRDGVAPRPRAARNGGAV